MDGKTPPFFDALKIVYQCLYIDRLCYGNNTSGSHLSYIAGRLNLNVSGVMYGVEGMQIVIKIEINAAASALPE